MGRGLLLIVSAAAAAGCGGPAPGCDETGCDDGFFCDVESDECVADCTARGCEGELVCDPGSRRCLESCLVAGCADGAHCVVETGLCEEDCTEGSCGDDRFCNPETRACEDLVVFDDPALEACVRADAGLGDGPILPARAAEVAHLECPDMGIQSIAGLERFTGLTDLTLWENDVADLSPLEGLTGLERLQLGSNRIADLSPLAGLTRLAALGLSVNEVSDLSPLAGLTALRWLNLDHNRIADVSPLDGLGEIAWLTIEGNEVADTGRLRELEADGVDVYFMGDGAAARLPDRDAARDLPRAGLGLGPAARAVPSFRADARGVVSFDFEVGGVIHEARHEFEGDVLFDGSRFLYRFAGVERAIGEVAGDEIFLCSGPYEQVCDLAFGRRFPEARDLAAPGLAGRPLEPVFTVSLSLREPRLLFDPPVDPDHPYGGYHGLLDPFVLASPNQLDAGSCLFMANTGAMEILMNQHQPLDQIAYEGDTDLSERYLMNASEHVPSSDMPYSITDVVRTYNVFGGSLLSRDYRFTVGYVRETASGSLVPASPTDEGAYASCSYNWFDELPGGWQERLTATPPADRTIVSLDPDLDSNSIWNVALMDSDVVERIKYELRTRRAPVVAVYNHYMYWHTDVIVGYDDARSIGECPMVRDSMTYYSQQGATRYVDRIRSHMDELGGCTGRGVFYVRDSIYEGTEEELWYDYSEVYRFRERYSQRIINRDYDWVRYLVNHVYTVHRL